MSTVRIPGWYFDESSSDKKSVPLHVVAGKVRLGPAYIKSVRRFEAADLEITDIKKFAGPFLKPTLVRGVVDFNSKSLVMFYIDELDVKELAIEIGVSCDDVLIGSSRRR
jgi:hypothetical protein